MIVEPFSAAVLGQANGDREACARPGVVCVGLLLCADGISRAAMRLALQLHDVLRGNEEALSDAVELVLSLEQQNLLALLRNVPCLRQRLPLLPNRRWLRSFCLQNCLQP